jgi:ATP-binding cassette, subfamily B, bacterial MsbA
VTPDPHIERTAHLKRYLRILSYLKPYTWVFLAAVVATFIFAGLDAFSLALIIPFLSAVFEPGEVPEGGGASGRLAELMDGTLGRLVDMQGDPQDVIRGVILFILAVFAIKNVFDFLRNYLVAWIEQAVTRDIRDELYAHLLELDLVFFGRTRMGQIMSRLTHDVEQLRTLVTKEVGKIISSVFEFAAVLTLLLMISPRLTLAAVVVLPGMLVVWGPLLKKLKKGDRKILDLAGEVNSHIQETLAGIRLVKTSAAEEHERGRFTGQTWSYFKAFVRTARWRALAQPITEMVGAVGTVVILWYGATLVIQGDIESAEFIGFLALSMKLYSPVKYLSKLPALIQPGLVAAERIFEFLDAPAEIRDVSDPRPFPGVEREIEYRDVSFAYREGDPVLRNISFRVPRGGMIALVGPSGSGKSTLVDLLGRFYEATSGQILVDGRDIGDFAIRSLRENLGIVAQETVLFHDTVRSNIAYGMKDVDQDAIEQAARAAYAHDFIELLPQGYDTVVGERGMELSGGQRQRIAIARAILRDPPILIFDEATSSLDTEAERLVQAAIERLLAGRTVFVIAHRLSTVQKADMILVLQDGEIVERGSHRVLLEQGGAYRRLYEMQFLDGGGTTGGTAGEEGQVGGGGADGRRATPGAPVGGVEGAAEGEETGDAGAGQDGRADGARAGKGVAEP